MTLIEAVAIFGAVTGGVSLWIGLRKLRRDSQSDPHLMWHVISTEETRGTWLIDLSPVGADAVAVGFTVHGVDVWSGLDIVPEVGRGQTVRVVCKTAEIGDAWVHISYASSHRPRESHQAWVCAVGDGRAGQEMSRQMSYLAATFWLRRYILGSPVRPGRGIPYRKSGWRDQHQLRAALRASKVRRWPSRTEKQLVRLPHQR